MITRRRRIRALTSAFAILMLVTAACGSRLDHDVIAARSAGLGVAGAGPAGVEGQPGVAEGGVPGAPGAAGDGAGDGTGGPGSSGSGDAGSGPGGQAGSGPGGGSGGAIVIGSVGTYSGPTGITNKQGPRALQAWAAQINAKGGINGRKVEVVVLNDGGDAAKSRSQVQELVEQRKVTALVSSFAGTSATKAWGPYVADKKVPVIGGACRDGWNDNPVLFNQCPSVESMAYGAVATGANYGRGKKFGALFCQEGGVCSQVEKLWFDSGYAKRAGLEPKYRARVSLTQPDFTSECIQARNAGVELLSVVADPNTLTRVASSCRRQNFNPEYLQPMNTVDAGTAGQTGLGNVMVPTGVFPFAGLSTPAYNEFATAWKRYGDGNAPGPSAAMGWAGAKIFEKAARAAGKDISSANLLKQLYKFRGERFGGLTVPLTFVAGKGTADSKCTFFMRARNGKWTAPSGDRPYCF